MSILKSRVAVSVILGIILASALLIAYGNPQKMQDAYAEERFDTEVAYEGLVFTTSFVEGISFDAQETRLVEDYTEEQTEAEIKNSPEADESKELIETPTPTQNPPTITPTPTLLPTPTEIPTPTSTPEPTVVENTEEIWDKLAECESGRRWDINTGNGYFGGLQFSQGAWESVGGQGNPADASREEQIEKGKMLQQMRGWGAWGLCAKRLGLTD